MKIINQLQRNIGRLALGGVVATMIVTGLAGCGDTNSPSTTEPTPTTAASSDVSVAPTDTPVVDTGSMAAPTQAPANASSSDQAAPAQAVTAQGDTGSSASTTQINATLKEWAIDLSQKEVPAGKVTINVTNEGMMRHNLTVIDSNGNQIGQTSTFASSEGPQTLAVDLKAGTYTLECSLPGHAQHGQITQLVVK